MDAIATMGILGFVVFGAWWQMTHQHLFQPRLRPGQFCFIGSRYFYIVNKEALEKDIDEQLNFICNF